ncbi:hypothetical protein [Streptomyces sp. 150FB]|nr:hypothetical protein [Streptomyces sp. 150FB]
MPVERPVDRPLDMAVDVYATFAKEGGRVGSGLLGAGTGGVARCA